MSLLFQHAMLLMRLYGWFDRYVVVLAEQENFAVEEALKNLGQEYGVR